MNSNRDEIKDVLGKFEAGQIDRRSFVQSLGLLGVSTFVANAVIQSPLGATKAFAAIGGPEERAWTLAKEAAAKATKKTLTVLIPCSIPNGVWYSLPATTRSSTTAALLACFATATRSPCCVATITSKIPTR